MADGVCTSIQLLCFAHAGASAASYLRWRRALPAFVEVVPVELPGRGRRRAEPFVHTLDMLLTDVQHSLGVPTGPFALFGHSLGASVAFAYAQRLRARSLAQPLVLFASASHAPGTRGERKLAWSDHELRNELLQLDGTPASVLSSPELLELALPVMRADYQLSAALHRQLTPASIAAPIHVLAGTQDDIPPHALSAWSALTDGPFELTYFTGGHFYLQEHEPRLLALIAGKLARAHDEPVYGADSARGGRDGQVAES